MTFVFEIGVGVGVHDTDITNADVSDVMLGMSVPTTVTFCTDTGGMKLGQVDVIDAAKPQKTESKRE